MHMSYLLILVVTVAIGAFATWYVNHQIKKYSHVPNSSHMTGYQVAVGMLSYTELKVCRCIVVVPIRISSTLKTIR